jgi:hypothetical protein
MGGGNAKEYFVLRTRRRIQYGLGLVTSRLTLLYYSLFRRRRFVYNGTELPYFFALYNETFRNERAVEISIARHYLSLRSSIDVLEVGNVLNHYIPFEHTVVDKYEKGESVLNCDIKDFRPDKRFDLIVSISTLEHVGWDEHIRYGKSAEKPEYDPSLYVNVLAQLKGMLKPHGTLVASMPLGFNGHLDSLFEKKESGFTDVYFLKRLSRWNEWKQVDYSQVSSARYSSPFPCANALAIGVFHCLQ